MSEGKICTKCNEYKYFYEYDKQPINKSRDGHRASCKQCNKINQRNHYQNNKEKYKQCYQSFIEKNPDYRNEYYIKNKI